MPESHPPRPAETFDPCDAGGQAGEGRDGQRLDGDGAPGPAGWLRQVVHVLLGQRPDAVADAGPSASAAAAAAHRGTLEEHLDRWPDGEAPPLTVLHAWLAESIGPLLVEAVARDGRDTGIQLAAQELHRRASQGEPIGADAWRVTLEPALREVYRRAYDGGQAFATASAAAASFALSRGYSEPDAAEYGRAYAEMNTEANLSAFADANALAVSGLLSQSFASADATAYARTYPAAYIRACVSACAEDAEACGRARAMLADGLTRALATAAVTV